MKKEEVRLPPAPQFEAQTSLFLFPYITENHNKYTKYQHTIKGG